MSHEIKKPENPLHFEIFFLQKVYVWCQTRTKKICTGNLGLGGVVAALEFYHDRNERNSKSSPARPAHWAFSGGGGSGLGATGG